MSISTLIKGDDTMKMVNINGKDCVLLTGKRADYYNRLYNCSEIGTVEHAYKSCSGYKYQAELSVLNDMNNIGGFDYRILTARCHFFTTGYQVWNENNDLWLIVDTYANTYAMHRQMYPDIKEVR